MFVSTERAAVRAMAQLPGFSLDSSLVPPAFDRCSIPDRAKPLGEEGGADKAAMDESQYDSGAATNCDEHEG